MKAQIQILENKKGLPARTIIHSVDEFEMHWHGDLELILVLEGSVHVGVGSEKYLLREDDLILINSDQLHSTRKTQEKNTLLAIQIDPNFYSDSFKNFSKLEFNCNSVAYESKAETFNEIRAFMAEIVWESNKKAQGYKMRIASHLYMLGEYLINNCEYKEYSDDSSLKDSDIVRVKRIIDYIKDNYQRQITLTEVAERENLNYYYLSSFIKDKMGISFSEILNAFRLDQAVKQLLASDKTILEISNNSGFANINSFNNNFKETYDITPSEYRKNAGSPEPLKPIKMDSYVDIDRTQALIKLFKHLDKPNNEKRDISLKTTPEIFEIDVSKKGYKFDKHWQKTTSFSRAIEGLRVNLQKQLSMLQKQIGFDYIRFHGIFSDEMMVYNLDAKGNVVYNWTYTDELLDLLLSQKLKPFFDLTFMPTALSKSNETVFWWKGNISPPKDMNLWTDLVDSFVRHCVSRYGLVEVESWIFEVWNEPDLTNVFWAASQEEYFLFYKETVKTIKAVSDKIKVGGPSTTYGAILQDTWIKNFLQFVSENNVPLDFVSVHIFQEYTDMETVNRVKAEILAGSDPLSLVYSVKKVVHPQGHFEKLIDKLNNEIKTYLNKPTELYVSEFNALSEFGSLVNDTTYVATFIVKTALSTINKADNITYWSFTDLMEEHKLGLSHFHGGYGLFNKDGLTKPAFNAFRLLSMLGNEVIEKNDEFIVTKNGENIQILAYNYSHFDELFMAGDTSHLNNRNRYSIYQPKEDLNIQVNLTHLQGNYKITNYKVNRQYGSIYDVWNNIHAPEHMSKEEIEFLKSQDRPKYKVDTTNIDKVYTVDLQVPVHGIELILIEKIK